MADELDWDSLDSGCLHWTVSRAKTLDGDKVIVGVVSDASALRLVFEHAGSARAPDWETPPAPLWLYVPSDLELPHDFAATVVVKRVPRT